MTSTSAIITAGGIGQRMGQSVPKQFLPLAGVPVIVHVIRVFQQNEEIDQIILVVPESHLQSAKELISSYFQENSCLIISGGKRRQDSVEAGMKAAGSADLLVVHDGARPFVTSEIITRCIVAAREKGSAIAAIPVKDTLKSVDDTTIRSTIDRTGVWQAQTPQVVQKNLLKVAYLCAKKDGFLATDEASLLENMGLAVSVVLGSEENIKITHPEDMAIAEVFMMQRNEQGGGALKIGHGYDAHRLVTDRQLILGGVVVPHEKGLLGHSDADVICHALCDALLGALGVGDIGRHFPDSDPQYKGISSIHLLTQVSKMLSDEGWRLGNADITVVAQKPKLAPFLASMEENMALACSIGQDALNVKATTTEEMGFPGRQEGIGCHAVVTILRVNAWQRLPG